MATLKKDRARKLLLEDADVTGSQSVSWSKGCPGMMKGTLVYQITMHPKFQSGKKLPGYEIVMSRADMLTVVSSWMAAEARDAMEAELKLLRAAGQPLQGSGE